MSKVSGGSERYEMLRKPEWLRNRDRGGARSAIVRKVLRKHGLNTVCSEALCPNRGHCYERGTATFLIMGRICTRSCLYCGIERAPAAPEPLNPAEPAELAAAASELGLEYVVITSVTRDDLPDGGASHFAKTVHAIRRKIPSVRIELLTPDFGGSIDALELVADSAPDVFNHNLETVEMLFPVLRPVASYGLSIELLERFASLAPGIPTKSGMMLGLGETPGDVDNALHDLRAAGVSILTLGQYLQPSRKNYPVARYVTPAEFDTLREHALEMGFTSVASGPLVRSSFHAELISSPDG